MLPKIPYVVLSEYLKRVEGGLCGLSNGRKRLLIKELASHFMDEAEAHQVQDEAGMRVLLSQKESPEKIAKDILSGEQGDHSHRSGAALMAGGLIGLVTGGYLFLLSQWPWHFSLFFAVAHGMSVGTGLFLARSGWQSMSASKRIFLATAFGALLAFPLGFTCRHQFLFSRLMYGGFTGYLVERYASNRNVGLAILDTVLFSVVDYIQAAIFHPEHQYKWVSEMTFNFILLFAVLAALSTRRFLAERWMLSMEKHLR